jgi:transcriptional regulator with XRE-family HTH domain
MAWNGEAIKKRLHELAMTQIALSKKLGVDRVSINNWINGNIPKGLHLIKLCKILGVEPDYFFGDSIAQKIAIPLHRTTRGKPVTEESQHAAMQLIDEYKSLFAHNESIDLVQRIEGDVFNTKTAKDLALILRKFASIEEGQPISYRSVFNLLDLLKIIPVFRSFPVVLNSYAFYYNINGYRLIFTNTQKNVLDLVFPLLHDTVHVLRDGTSNEYSEEEERFCDTVANYAQFPDGYVAKIAAELKRKSPGEKINILKQFSKQNGHSLYGIVKRLKPLRISIPDSYGGADTKMRQGIPVISQILFKSNSPTEYASTLKALTPHFFSLLKSKAPHVGDRVFATWAGLDSALDGAELKRVILQE